MTTILLAGLVFTAARARGRANRLQALAMIVLIVREWIEMLRGQKCCD